MNQAGGVVCLIFELQGGVIYAAFALQILLYFVLYLFYLTQLKIIFQLNMRLQVKFLVGEHPGVNMMDV